MHRTEAAGNDSNLYVNQVLPGTPGTILDASDRNAVQEEICDVIESAGLTLRTAGADKTAAYKGQLKEAIDTMIENRIEPDTGSGTITFDVLDGGDNVLSTWGRTFFFEKTRAIYTFGILGSFSPVPILPALSEKIRGTILQGSSPWNILDEVQNAMFPVIIKIDGFLTPCLFLKTGANTFVIGRAFVMGSEVRYTQLFTPGESVDISGGSTEQITFTGLDNTAI